MRDVKFNSYWKKKVLLELKSNLFKKLEERESEWSKDPDSSVTP